MLGLPVEWDSFYITNAVVIILGIVQAELASELPLAPLIYASLMLINPLFFHIAPMIRARGRYSPGTATAVILFVPVGIAVWWFAAVNIGLSLGTCLAAILGGALLMAYPVVLLRLRSKPYLRQDHA